MAVTGLEIRGILVANATMSRLALSIANFAIGATNFSLAKLF